MKNIVFRITLAVSILILVALLLETYVSGEMMTFLFNKYMSEAAVLNDPYPLIEGGRIVTGPAEKGFMDAIYSRLLWIDVPVTFIVFIISYVIARSSTKSIRELGRGVREIAKGNLNYKVHVRESGDVGLLADSFNQMAEKLAGAQSLRKQFFADAAHELKTPIAVIKGNLEGMMDGVIPNNKESLGSLLEEADYLNDIIGDIKYLALADSGQLELSRQVININGIVLECVNRLKPSAMTRNLSVTTNFKKDPLMAFVDPERITQVIYNLLINAGKYTPNGGSVVIGTEVILENGVEFFKVTVRDTGIGISGTDIPLVFERFYRADKSRDKKTGGIGLGLSIVKKLTELHGGRVGVTSELGKGSSFYIVIPMGYTPPL